MKSYLVQTMHDTHVTHCTRREVVRTVKNYLGDYPPYGSSVAKGPVKFEIHTYRILWVKVWGWDCLVPL